MGLPTPEEFRAAVPRGGLLYYPSSEKRDFEEWGGRTRPTKQQGKAPDRYVVVAAPASYDEDKHTDNALDAMENYWSLFEDGGWTVMVWDTQENEGWAYQHVGPDWADFLLEAMGRTPTPSTPSSGDPNLLERVNLYRAQFGKQPLASGEWSDSDLEEFASNIPTPNPRHGRRRGRRSNLKRKLML